jgi:transposase
MGASVSPEAGKLLARLAKSTDPLEALRDLDAAARETLRGVSCREIARQIGLAHKDRTVRRILLTPDTHAEQLRRMADANLDELQKGLLRELQRNRDQRYTYQELSERFDRSVATVKAAVLLLHADGYKLQEVMDGVGVTLPKSAIANRPPLSIDFRGTELLFGVVSDTHLGSIHADLGLLDSVYDLYASEGVSTVLHCGDLTEGPGNRGYPGHSNDCLEECQTWRGLEEYASGTYPARPGVRTLCISSSKSHDGWEWGKGGRCPTADICDGRGGAKPLAPRDDMEWVGHDNVDVLMGPDERTRVRLHHPDGGSSYALSYAPQKFVEGLPGGTKPHAYFIGHYHQALITRFRNVRVAMVPCMQWKTPLFLRYGKEPVLGAYIVHAHLDPDGWIRSWRVDDLAHHYVSDEPHA